MIIVSYVTHEKFSLNWGQGNIESKNLSTQHRCNGFITDAYIFDRCTLSSNKCFLSTKYFIPRIIWDKHDMSLLSSISTYIINEVWPAEGSVTINIYATAHLQAGLILRFRVFITFHNTSPVFPRHFLPKPSSQCK